MMLEISGLFLCAKIAYRRQTGKSITQPRQNHKRRGAVRTTTRHYNNRDAVLYNRDAARHVATKTVALHGDNGRGNLRVAKTPPLQSAFAGMPLRVVLRFRCRHCRRLHARTMPPMETLVFITDAEGGGRALATLGTASTEDATAASPMSRNLYHDAAL